MSFMLMEKYYQMFYNSVIIKVLKKIGGNIIENAQILYQVSVDNPKYTLSVLSFLLIDC